MYRIPQSYEIIFNDIKSVGLFEHILIAKQEGYIWDAKTFITDLTEGKDSMLNYLIEQERYEDCALLTKEINIAKYKYGIITKKN